MTELKPCPFCGKEAVLKKASFSDIVYVQCNNKRCAVFCGTIGKNTKEEAVRAWNTRANWHTGTPTEDGWYLLNVGCTIPFRVAYMRKSQWLSIDDSIIRTDAVIAWQKIEPYKEISE